MKQRLASLVLLVVLVGGAFAGVPLQFGGSECGMTEMMEGMDCCKAALLQSQSPEVADAKLCCALNCAQGGTSSPPASVRIAPPSAARIPNHQTLPQPILQVARFGRIDSQHEPPGSPPTYLLNLAFLI
ncbi:MAG TPA: hypothetical protein VFU37_21010 [Pyrinomonadaceae bacterium]|nr:hypothetical protein [Pyrinomonadaceae bacterium]